LRSKFDNIQSRSLEKLPAHTETIPAVEIAQKRSRKNILTLEDIHKLDYQEIIRKGGKVEKFKPSDLFDMDDDDVSEDEILAKFKQNKAPIQNSKDRSIKQHEKNAKYLQ
jgi:hypothetical protein